MEYFLLFAAVIIVTVLGVTAFDDDLRASLEEFFDGMSKTMSTPP